MRLVALLLTAAASLAPTMAAQGRAHLPWERQLPLDWQAQARGSTETAEPAVASTGAVLVTITGDGTVQVRDPRGLVQLQAGLPGRPLRAWRDGGIPLPAPTGEWHFPEDTPLKQSLGALGWCAEDFRPFLQGLLWVIEDGEAYLTVLHPATGRLIYLPLPSGRDLQLRFRKDHLEVLAGEAEKSAPRRWVLPWIGLLPRLAALGPHPNPSKPGTALAPFPKG